MLTKPGAGTIPMLEWLKIKMGAQAKTEGRRKTTDESRSAILRFDHEYGLSAHPSY